MKNLFPGFFKESKDDIKKVWADCIFVFDANILLNFYRYSDTTRKEFFGLLSKISERVWLPNRAAEEYFINRLSVIDQQEKSYEETINKINLLKKGLENSRQHPFVSTGTMKKVESVFKILDAELLENKENHVKRIYDDDIKDSIFKIFGDNVGEPYSNEELEKIIEEGEERFKQKISPGFKDAIKYKNSEVFTEKCKKYGDLIIWYQVINKSNVENSNIVFVTDDKKEDWWEIFKGKTIGPNPDLVKEFKDKTNNSIYMYHSDRFLELSRENLNENISEEILEEIRDANKMSSLIDDKVKKTISGEKHKYIQPYLGGFEPTQDEFFNTLISKKSIEKMNTIKSRIKSFENLLDDNISLENRKEIAEEIEHLHSKYNNELNKFNESMRSYYKS